MLSIFKWSLLGLGFIGGAGLAVLLPILAALWNTVPEANQTLIHDQLGNDVVIILDRYGVPHIEAENMADANTALGYMHARDRLWQMDMLRNAGKGRLSERFGEPTVETDIFMRTIGLAKAAEASFDALRPETKEVLAAYARGVNRFITLEPGFLKTQLPPEYLILGATPEPWEPSDSVLIIKVMAASLDRNMNREIQRLALASYGMTPEEIADMVPHGPRDNPPPLPDLRALYSIGPNGLPRPEQATIPRKPDYHLDNWLSGISTSNNWVVAGSRTDTGKPILANDPHLGFTAPSSFHITHLAFNHEGRNVNLYGGALPGSPAILLGRNDRLAWGLTTTGMDAQDLTMERQLVNEPEKYFSPEGIRTFEVRQETLKIAGKPDRNITIRSSHNGPILPRKFRNIEAFLPERHDLAVQWTALSRDDTTLDAALGLALHEDVKSFSSLVDRYVSPMQSIVVGDIDGNIGLVVPGRVPVREPSNRLMGRAPATGWNSSPKWPSYLPKEQLPVFLNPADGALATANSNFLPSDYEPFIAVDWATHFRQFRAEELVIDRPGRETVETSIEAQGDIFSPALKALRDRLVQITPKGLGVDQQLLSALEAWDGEMRAERPEPLVMMAWFRHMHQAVFKDDLRSAYPLFERASETRADTLLRALGLTTARPWCDDQTTSSVETCGAVANASLQKAIEEIEETQGGDWRLWQWGRAHEVIHEHRPFGSVAALAGFFNIELPTSGGSYTLRRAQTRFENEDRPYAARHGAAFRGIYDLSDLDNSRFVLSTGQSGNVFSPHYRDQATLWNEMKFLQMSVNPQEYTSPENGKIVLTPSLN